MMNNNMNNMMGMGRGAGGMMMQGQTMGMPGMPNTMNANLQTQPMMQPDQQNNNMKQVLEAILRKLSQEMPKPGWWRGVNMSERVQNTQRVLLLLHQLMRQDISSALLVAQAFESSSFNSSPNKPHYDMAIKNKIQEIQTQGQQRAMAGMGQPMPVNLNMMMGNPQMAANNNQVFNPNMLNANMQQAMMNNNNPMVQQLQPGQVSAGILQNNMMQNPMQAAQSRQNGMQMPFRGTLTPQEQQAINQRASDLYATMTPADKETAKLKLPQHELMALQSRGEDPALHMCKRLATAQFLNVKQKSMGQQPVVPGAQFGGPNGMGVMPNGQVHGLLNAANGGPMVARNLQQGFGGNNFFMNQQAQAIRQQEEGQTVVPASQQGTNQTGMGMQQTNLNGMQRQPQPQALNTQRSLQNRPVQPGMQNQNLLNQGSRMAQAPSQAGPAMGRLNGSLNQTSRPENSTPQQTQLREPQRTGPSPQQPQRTGPQQQINQSLSQVQTQAQLQQLKMAQQAHGPTMNNGMPNITPPEGIRDQFARLSPADQAKIIAQHRVLQQRSKNPQFPVSAPGTNQPLGTVANQSQPPTAMPAAQPATAGQPSMHENGIRPNIAGMRRMTPEEINLADRSPFPPQVFQIPGLKQQNIPEKVKSWGELKNWVRTQPFSQETITAVMALQEKQYAFLRLRQQQQQQQSYRAQQLQVSPQRPQLPEQRQPPQSQAEPALERQPSQHPQQPQLEAQQQRQSGMSMATKEKPAAQMAPMAPSKPVNAAQEQMMRFLLSLPDELTPELCATLKARIPPLRQKSDEEIRLFVSIQKRKIRQIQQQQQQQQRDVQGVPNGQPQSFPGGPMSRQPSMQTQVSINQPSVPASKQQASSLPLNPTSTPVKQEKPTSESLDSRRSLAEQTSEPSLPQPQVSSAARPNPQINEAKMRRLQQIAREVQAAYRTGAVQNMNTEGKEKMRKVLMQIQPFMPTKILSALFFYFANVDPGNEAMARQFLMSRAAIIDQFQDEKCTTVKETFTISVESAEKALEAFKLLYTRIRAASANIPLGQKPTSAPLGPQSSQPGKPIDVKAVAHKIKVEQPPAAPTSETPPNSFHQGLSPPNRAPNGAPTYAPTSSNELTQDQLVLPENRKRKLNANNQLSAKTQSPPQVPKTVPPPAIKPEPSFRCTQLGCEYQRTPFPTGEMLARHIEDSHKEKEPEDGLQFALEMARQVLNLDVKGSSVKVPAMEKSASAQTMKKSISSQSQTLKVEGGVSMSRATTQTSNLGIPRTPQSIGRSWDKATPSKAETNKDPLTPDSWADCPVTPVELARLFPLLEAVQGTMDMASLTPASTLASGKSERNTPNSDVADSIAVVSEDVGNRIPLSFSNDILGYSPDASLMDDDVLGMSWDEAFPSTKRRKTDINGGFDANLFSLHLSNEDDFF